MIPVSLIVEDQVLQLAPLDSHQHSAWAVVTGVSTRWAGVELIDALGQARTQTPQPRQRDSSRRLLALGLVRVAG